MPLWIKGGRRVPAALPIYLDEATGLTRDVSASGLYFETNSTLSVGDPVNFRVEFDVPAGKMVLNCRGEIVRTEKHADRTGVAIRIAESIMGMMGFDQAPVVS